MLTPLQAAADKLTQAAVDVALVVKQYDGTILDALRMYHDDTITCDAMAALQHALRNWADASAKLFNIVREDMTDHRGSRA